MDVVDPAAPSSNELMDEASGQCPKEMSDESLLSDMEELRIFRSLLVSGRLKGEHPPGFLSQLRDLPNEITLKIWSYLPKRQLRSFRQVSKHWKALWESMKEPKICLDSMNIAVEDEKFVVKTRTFHGFGRKVELRMDTEALKQAFSLVTVEPDPADEYRSYTLVLEGAAANSMLLQSITSTGWVFNSVAFEGDLRSLTENDLHTFLSSLSEQSARAVSLHFMDVTVNNGLITDRIIEACGHKLNELVIILNVECAAKKPVILTERSLPFIVREGLVSIIPDVSGISISSLKKAISNMFAGSVPVAPHPNGFGGFCTNSMLAFPTSSGFSMESLSHMKVKVPKYQVHKTHYARGFTVFEKGKFVNHFEFAKLKGGMIEFTCGSESTSRKTYTLDIAEPERLDELRERFAIAKIDVSESHIHHAFSYDSYLGADYGAALSDYSADYSGDHDHWDDYDADYYDEMDEIDYDGYMGM